MADVYAHLNMPLKYDIKENKDLDDSIEQRV